MKSDKSTAKIKSKSKHKPGPKLKPKAQNQKQQRSPLLLKRLNDIDKRLKIIEEDRARYYHGENGYWSEYYRRLREQLNKETGMNQLQRDLALIEGDV
jgi:hypothetical protein